MVSALTIFVCVFFFTKLNLSFFFFFFFTACQELKINRRGGANKLRGGARKCGKLIHGGARLFDTLEYVVQAQYEHRTAADTHLQYHCA